MSQVRGSVLGIIDYGRIESQGSVLAELFGMKVVFYDSLRCLPLGNATQLDSLEQVLAISDALCRHAPASIATKNMIIASKISQLEDEAILVNNARLAVAEALWKANPGGCAVDVFPMGPEKNG